MSDGGPAFPLNECHDDGTHHHSHAGMSLRDYFAAQALPAIYADRDSVAAWRTSSGTTTYAEWAASLAYQMADAMLKERG